LFLIPNQSSIDIDLARPQTPNTGGFETASGLAPPELGDGGGSARSVSLISGFGITADNSTSKTNASNNQGFIKVDNLVSIDKMLQVITI
jgi:hypothetical protein